MQIIVAMKTLVAVAISCIRLLRQRQLSSKSIWTSLKLFNADTKKDNDNYITVVFASFECVALKFGVGSAAWTAREYTTISTEPGTVLR